MVPATRAQAEDYTNIPRDTPLQKAIYACDELVGFIGACVIESLKPIAPEIGL